MEDLIGRGDSECERDGRKEHDECREDPILALADNPDSVGVKALTCKRDHADHHGVDCERPRTDDQVLDLTIMLDATVPDRHAVSR